MFIIRIIYFGVNTYVALFVVELLEKYFIQCRLTITIEYKWSNLRQNLLLHFKIKILIFIE